MFVMSLLASKKLHRRYGMDNFKIIPFQCLQSTLKLLCSSLSAIMTIIIRPIIKEWATQYTVIPRMYDLNTGYIIDCSGQCLEFGSTGMEWCVATLAVPDGCRDLVPRNLNVTEFQKSSSSGILQSALK